MDLWNEKHLQKEITKIPSCNMLKFYLDLQKLVKLAQQVDYDDYHVIRKF